MTDIKHPSRRGFLRSAFATALIAPAIPTLAQNPFSSGKEAEAGGADAMVLGRITLDRAVVDEEGMLTGALRFLRAVSGPVVVDWIDSFGRVAARQTIAADEPTREGVPFTFNMRGGLTYVNWLRVTVNGVPQVAGAKFMLSPKWTPWDDFHTISWAHYPDGFYEQLRAAGMDAIIAYTKENNDPVLDNNFRFYVEQMAWEVFAIYHKNQPEWRALITHASMDRNNMEWWVRSPCVNDPETTAYLRENLTKYVRDQKRFRPLFYNIADELGQADQIKPNDFCHSQYCTAEFAKYLKRKYRMPSNVAQQWQLGEFTHWDTDALDAYPKWEKTGPMIGYTTTDRAFEGVAYAAVRTRYKTIGEFNRAWGTSFPVPAGNGAPAREGWEPILAVARESLSAPTLDAASLEKAMGPLDQANARWGGLGAWDAPNEPTKFKSWAEVAAFVRRYFKELGEVTSTRGWNVSPWADFRNFMDETFADAVKRAADISKREDPHALCGTEGGQSPFAFGWYNYEQVMRAVDVIEPYNIGNNVEVVRSLKPTAKMMSTHGFSAQAGPALTEKQRIAQRQETLPIWWGLFHQHQAALIWDDNEPGNQFIDMQTGKLTSSAETFSALFHELRSGIGRLFINLERKQDGIAIHYSQGSIQAHWLLDNLKYAREWMLQSGGTSDSLCIAVRNSWTKLIEDLALQYNFVGTKQIEAGALGSGEYKVFILPESIAVSEAEAAAIRAFVESGGTVIADCRAGELNGVGRDLGHGLLDDVFGIRRGEAVASHSSQNRLEWATQSEGLQLKGLSTRGLRVGSQPVELAGGTALARAGSAPAMIVNKVGAGRAIFMNLEIGDYAYQRLQADVATSLPEIVEEVLAAAGVKPAVRVLGADGKRLRGTEIVRFANGGLEQVAVFRNPQFDNGGFGAYPKLLSNGSAPVLDPALGHVDNSQLEREAEVTIEFAGEMETYDVRGRKDLGRVQQVKATLDAFAPLVYTRAPQAISGLKVDVGNVAAGEMAEVRLTDEGALPEGALRVVRVEFMTPTGEPYPLYARNALVRETPHVERVPLAVNDPKGAWKVTAHDWISGQVVEGSFQVG